MKKIYPAVFLEEDIGYSVFFPDLEGCHTQGEDLEEALKMAEDALAGYLASLLDDGLSIPDPSVVKDVVINDKEFVTLISCDAGKYRNSKAVKKTLTIPFWLNEEAEKNHVNFSSVLQKGLRDYLNV